MRTNTVQSNCTSNITVKNESQVNQFAIPQFHPILNELKFAKTTTLRTEKISERESLETSKRPALLRHKLLQT